MEPSHRKTIKHFNIEGHAHLLTFSCNQRKALLADDGRRELLSRCIDRANEIHAFQLIAFVYMPEHIHLLEYPCTPESRVEKLLYAIKKPFSDKLKADLVRSDSPLLNSLIVRERPGKSSFRFWQEGPGHDRNMFSIESCIKAAEYLHNNPVRRRLCLSPDQWRWSSWKFYHVTDWPGDSSLPAVQGFPP